MTNPTSAADVSDSGGWFPQIFAAEDTFYDITLKNSAGATIKTYVNVPSIGSSATTISRDYGNSRMKILGSGGVVYFEAGDPSGDDTGGKHYLSGWNATQADTATIDAAATTLTGTLATTGAANIGGTLTENSKSLASVAATVATFSGASVAIPLTNSPSGIRLWDIDIIDLVASAGAVQLDAVFSFDGGGTYATAANYAYSWFRPTTGNAVATSVNNTGQTAMTLLTPAAGTPRSAVLRIITPASTGITYFDWTVPTKTTTITPVIGTGFYNSSSARATHIKLTPDSGTIAGSYRVLPQRGF